MIHDALINLIHYYKMSTQILNSFRVSKFYKWSFTDLCKDSSGVEQWNQNKVTSNKLIAYVISHICQIKTEIQYTSVSYCGFYFMLSSATKDLKKTENEPIT